MIKIENTDIFGWEAAIRGARNPMNSWEKSDSAFFNGFDYTDDFYFCDINGNRKDWNDWFHPSEKEPSKYSELRKWIEWKKKREKLDAAPFPKPYHDDENGGCRFGDILIGPNDHKLLMNLCKGGTEEAKWRRMIHVQMDVTAPLYWWKEFDTYKIGTVSNSCSTMHKIQAKEFTLDDFSCEHLKDILEYDMTVKVDHPIYMGEKEDYHLVLPIDILSDTITVLNAYREKFLESKNKKYWWQMIQLLPSSYNQKRTIDLNYEVLASQYRQRKDHKLDEWHQYCDWIKTLPYSEFITMEET